jgi:hypothetical protein
LDGAGSKLSGDPHNGKRDKIGGGLECVTPASVG